MELQTRDINDLREHVAKLQTQAVRSLFETSVELTRNYELMKQMWLAGHGHRTSSQESGKPDRAKGQLAAKSPAGECQGGDIGERPRQIQKSPCEDLSL